MARQINISDDNYREVKSILASRGENVDVDEFVNRTLSRELFFETVRSVKARAKEVDPGDLEQIIEEAVEAAKAERRKQTPGADCS
jgi:hypothetical protein